MNITRFVETVFKRFLPSPFAIAVLLTLLTMVLALLFTDLREADQPLLTLWSYWEEGIWNQGLVVFAYQMMLILVLGHILVLSAPMNRLIQRLTNHVKDTRSAVVLVSATTLLVSFFNWGLGLIFGAILARKVAEAAERRGFQINYPLVGAAGYSGLMIWHGGISGSAPSKVSEAGHLNSFIESGLSADLREQLPELIPYSQTIFSVQNLILFGLLLVLIPLVLGWMSSKTKATPIQLPEYHSYKPPKDQGLGAERIDRSPWWGMSFGMVVLAVFLSQYWDALIQLIITPNMLNFFMLGLGLVLHRSFNSFLHAVDEAIKGASGILIQFPLYFGIMGIMSSSGMVGQISDFFVSIASETTLPLFTFLSAGLVNVFVPSGGGQWAIQGPIVIESALKLGVPLNKALMALAYGDQVTNMLQPFWALPLLGITKLKAKQILPYTLILMLVGTATFILGLLAW